MLHCSVSSGSEATAFKNPDGTLVVVLLNQSRHYRVPGL